MEVVALLLARHLVAHAIGRELRRARHQQHPAITNAGLVALQLL